MYTDSLYTHTHTHTQLIYFVVQQKLTQHCKAIILQEKKKDINTVTVLGVLTPWELA